MRLTLRTLLAYLDNTLDPEDVEALRAKLEESGFATQLVSRIRESLTKTELTAPSPNSVHPIGEPNVISEYLDSTLTAEQIAEIERACLESEPHLAEAAACHQILTMVLGKPAAVSDELRQHIYTLPEASASKTPSGSFSSVSIPPEESPGLIAGGIPTVDAVPEPASKTVQPVGPDDSGVSDAPTRLRETAAIGSDAAEESDAAVAGDRERGRLKVSDVYAGDIRTSRVAPWIVSLALAGVFLFVLTRIFSPLLAQVEPAEERISLDSSFATEQPREVELPPDESPPLEVVGTPATSIEPSIPDEVEARGEERPLPTPIADVAPDTDAALEADATPDPDTAPDEPPPSTVDVATEDLVMPPDPGSDVEAEASATSAAEETPAKTPDTVASTALPDQPPMEAKTAAADVDAPPSSEELEKPDQPSPPDEPKPPAGDANGLAKVMKEATLLIGRAGEEDWIRIGKDTSIRDQMLLINPPGFRSPMSTAGGQIEFTLVDATRASWSKDPEGGDLGVSVEFGRALITAKAAGASTKVVLGGYPLVITLAEPETVAAVETRFFRQPGLDPSDPDNHRRIARVFSVQGNVQVQAETGTQPLETGQQWLIRGQEVAPVAALKTVPSWVDPPEAEASSIESEARAGLLQLLSAGEPLMLALSEATSFRRSEVGALAAQTLLLMGNGSVYFGGDGVLSNPKQRAYWPSHYLALRSVVDQSAQSAQSLATSITEMDAADGKTLFRLLVGFSQKQLVEGGDEELINMLESNSMAVRVLAIENLRAITGTTLYYRAEEENLVRRAQATKKWSTRQRKGDIRWNVE